MIGRLLAAFALGACLQVQAADAVTHQSAEELSRQGTLLRLQGNFDAASLIEQQLIDEIAEPVGHIFALNTIITHLTWDETNTTYNMALENHASRIFDWCEPLLEKNPDNVRANYYCGQANFALAYYYGLNGRYFQAGQRGTKSIDLLEAALATDPTLIDAKMHLGVAYFVADNLPPFIKMFSRLLWFIPTGNSEKSLPYLLEVVEHGDEYPDVARYIYSTLLMENDSTRLEARAQLTRLVNRYPGNARFQLRLISLLIMDKEYEESLQITNRYLAANPVEPEKSLASIWKVRALLGLTRNSEATALFNKVSARFRDRADDLPGWSIAWHLLTDAQLHDLANRRAAARQAYTAILDLARTTYVNEKVLEAAESGLKQPFAID